MFHHFIKSSSIIYLLTMAPFSYCRFLHPILPIFLNHQLSPFSLKFSGLLEVSPMGHHHSVKCGSFISFALFFLIISTWVQRGIVAEGRKTLKQNGFEQRVREDKTSLRARIGSRPPRCEGRCSSCGHCEAIQVPANPQVQKEKMKSSRVSTIDAYGRGDDNSSTANYKPMSWKCKCGNLIFNP